MTRLSLHSFIPLISNQLFQRCGYETRHTSLSVSTCSSILHMSIYLARWLTLIVIALEQEVRLDEIFV